MRSGLPRTFLLLSASLFLPPGLVPKPQQTAERPAVEIEGLNQQYPSCALVEFSVHNISGQEVHVEVYAEQLKSQEWTYADYPYDLTDPKSLYIKRVMVNPAMMQTGASLAVKYDRCMKPKFVKETKSAFANAIRKKDRGAASPVLQRLRIDVYILDQGHDQPDFLVQRK